MTTPDEFVQVEELFHELCDVDVDRREKRLAEVAGERPEVAAQVRRLLTHQPVREATWADDPSGADPRRMIGERVGPYRIDGVLGEGGMGVVYAAQQSEPVERRVALKLIRWGADSRQVVARFESERQALARMSHSNIAQVFDTGTAGDGRPYFAMELVRGEPITAYCDRKRLGPRARLELFAKVCDAVQHAHQRGVIHRDLKPSNVIVTDESGAAEPKVIDFGIAKATEQRLPQDTYRTRVGQLIGTPEYMSPEQADLDHRYVDTRSDVYALGVLLYELLAGQLPLDIDKHAEASVGEILRRIREVEPPAPSARVRALADAGRTVAELRGTEPRSLARTLDGDLDWIVMRALEKDRERRYGSVSELVNDVRNYLDDRPVVAGPPSLTYRTRKFVRRHRVLVGAVAAVLLTLVLGVAGTTVALVRAVKAERLAAAERDNAELRLHVSEQVSSFLVHLFESSDPLDNAPDKLTVEALLQRGVDRVEADLQNQPSVRADVLRSLGRVYGGMGHYRKARELLERAVTVRESVDGDRIENISSDLNELAIVYRRLGELDLATETHRKALALLDQRGMRDELEYATHLNGLAIIQMRRRDYVGAREGLQHAAQVFRREGHANELTALNNLGILHSALGEHGQAVEVLEQVLARREAESGPDHPRLAPTLNSLANALVNVDRFDEADAYYQRALTIWTDSLGPQHLNVARVYNNLGFMYGRQERWPDAVALYRQALETKEAIYGAGHVELASALTNLAHACTSAGDYEAAEGYLERADRIARDDPRADARAALVNSEVRGLLRLRQARFDEAAALFEATIEGRRELEGEGTASVDSLLEYLAEARRGAAGAETGR